MPTERGFVVQRPGLAVIAVVLSACAASSNGGGGAGTGGAAGTGSGPAGSGAAGTGSGAAGTGSGAAGSGSAGASGTAGGPPHVVGKCDTLAAVGVWENITPPGVDLSGFGLSKIVTAPSNPSTLYVTGDGQTGIRRSTDCGATWIHLDTGTLGAEIDKGTPGVTLDPTDPDILWTGSLYGLNGFFKSTNGGVDFAESLNGDVKKYAPYGGFVGGVNMDPGDHLHLLLGWHDKCAAPYNSACFGETTDGGVTWTMRNGDPSWDGSEGCSLQFLTSDSWLFSSQTNGMWLSKNRGATWAKVEGAQISHGGGQLYRAPNGSFFLGSAVGVLFSPDGAAWSTIPESGNLIAGVIGDGTTVWTGSAFPFNPPHPAPGPGKFHAAQVTAPTSWKTFPSPDLSSGAAVLAYDPDHHVLYSAAYFAGLWRVVVP